MAVDLDAAPVLKMLEQVAEKMRELGVERFQFDLPMTDLDDPIDRRLHGLIELGPAPLPPDAEETEHVQRLRDHNELAAMRREERRRYAAVNRFGPAVDIPQRRR